MSRGLAARLLTQLGHSPQTSEPSMASEPALAEEQSAETKGRLSTREREVLELIARGARDRDIAEGLVLTESTVKKHVQSILRKLNARNRTEAVARYRSDSY